MSKGITWKKLLAAEEALRVADREQRTLRVTVRKQADRIRKLLEHVEHVERLEAVADAATAYQNAVSDLSVACGEDDSCPVDHPKLACAVVAAEFILSECLAEAKGGG